jgi:hypothetical protein
VSFKLATDPLATRICWCRDCQHLSANGTVNVMVPAESLAVSGVVADFVKVADSGHQITRQFCPNCGTHLFAMSSGRPQFRVVRAGNLDEPSSIKPSVNIWTSSAPSWACIDPSVEQSTHQPMPPPASGATGLATK